MDDPATDPDPRLEPPRHRDRVFLAFAVLGLAVGVVANLVVTAPVVLWIFTTPPGTPIRPMGWTALVAQTAYAALFLGVPSSILGVLHRGRLMGMMALVLCFAPWPWAMVILRLSARVMGWQIED